jgi:hypothetical protein
MEAPVSERRLAWGLEPPPSVPAAWGARAIYSWSKFSKSYIVDIVHDRRDMFGDDKELWDWINNTGMKMLREKVNELRLGTDSEEMIEIRDSGFLLAATPRGSYGYLYIGSWRGNAEDDTV